MVDCSVGLHDTEMGPARLTAVTPAAIDVAVGSGASKKQGRGTRPTSQTQRAEDRDPKDRKPSATRPIFLRWRNSFCYKTCAKQTPQRRGSDIRPRARATRKSKHVRIHGCRIDAPCDCEVRAATHASPSSPVGLGYTTRPRALPDHTVHRARPDMRWPMLIWEQSLGHAWHGFAHAPLTWHRTPPPPDCRTHERHVDTHTVTSNGRSMTEDSMRSYPFPTPETNTMQHNGRHEY
jgi:hypothetical protein